IQYLLTNVYPHKTLENVVVHFFIARQEKEGQKDLPDVRGDVIIETAFDMDFKPGGKAGQRSTLRIDTPGAYLVRVETRNTQSGHERLAVFDLVVEKGRTPGAPDSRGADGSPSEVAVSGDDEVGLPASGAGRGWRTWDSWSGARAAHSDSRISPVSETRTSRI